MAHDRLDYSALRLFGFLALMLLMAVGSAGFALAADNLAATRRLGPFALLGPDGLRLVCGACALFFFAGAAGLFRRLVSDRTAAAIRHDGIILNGIFRSRRIGWRNLGRLHLRSKRTAGTVNHYISVEDHAAVRAILCGPLFAGGVPVQLLDGRLADAADWIERANAARHRALSPPSPLPPPARTAIRTKAGFGRRVA